LFGPVLKPQYPDGAIEALRQAQYHAAQADCPQTLKKGKRALKSADRHMKRREEATLFEMREDRRPAPERTAAGRYLEPSLFEGGSR
jgi:hypothetical protein